MSTIQFDFRQRGALAGRSPAPPGGEDLPVGWVRVPLADLGDVQLGKMLDKAKRTRGTQLAYLRNLNVRWASFYTDDLLTMPFEDHELERYSVRAGDVIVCEGGEPGRAAIWSGRPTDMKYQKALHRVRPFGAVTPPWLVYALMHDAKLGRLDRLFTGTTIKHFTRTAILKWEVAVPPLGEQRRIIEGLEVHFSRLDAAVEGLERVQANLKRYRASVLKAAVEGRLVPTEAELARTEGRDYEPASALLERILVERRKRWEQAELVKMKAKRKAPGSDKWKAKYTEPAAPDTSELPELPEGWCWATIDAIAECLDSQRCPVSKKERAKRVGNIPYYGANGQVGWIDDWLFDEPLVLVVEDETFTGRTKPFSYAIRGKSWVNNHAHVLRAIPLISTEFLNYALSHYPFTPLTTGTTGRRKLTKRALMEAPFAVPPLQEQARTVDAVEEALTNEDALESQVDRSLVRSDKLRQSILRGAFEGRLVDQDPSDEPASALLERMRVEREAAGASKETTRRGRGSRGARRRAT